MLGPARHWAAPIHLRSASVTALCLPDRAYHPAEEVTPVQQWKRVPNGPSPALASRSALGGCGSVGGCAGRCHGSTVSFGHVCSGFVPPSSRPLVVPFRVAAPRPPSACAALVYNGAGWVLSGSQPAGPST